MSVRHPEKSLQTMINGQKWSSRDWRRLGWRKRLFFNGWKQRRWTQSQKKVVLVFLEVGFEVTLRFNRDDCISFEVKVHGFVVTEVEFVARSTLSRFTARCVYNFHTKHLAWRNIQNRLLPFSRLITEFHANCLPSVFAVEDSMETSFRLCFCLSRPDREVECQAENFYFNLWSRKKLLI